MNRLYNLLTVMVLTAGAFFAAPEALAKVLTGTGGEDRLIGTDRIDRLTGLAGEDNLKGRAGDDRLNGGSGEDHLKATAITTASGRPRQRQDHPWRGQRQGLRWLRRRPDLRARHRGGGFYRLRAASTR